MAALFIHKPCNNLEVREEDFDEEEEVGKWFGDLTASFTKSLKETIPQTKTALEDIAGAIQRSANALATELANFEREAGIEARKWAENLYESDENQEYYGQYTTLPWQVEEELYVHDDSENHIDTCTSKKSLVVTNLVEDMELKSEIFSLSTKESTFTQPFKEESDECKQNSLDDDAFAFELESHMILIQRLLQMDKNLRKAHARLSAIKVNELFFWKNYFFHCAALKQGRDMVKIELKCQDETGDDLIESKDEQHVQASRTLVSHSSVSNKENERLLRTFSMEDMVLVGGENDELLNMASKIS